MKAQYLYFLVLALFLGQQSFAQTGRGQISGEIRNLQNNPMDGTTITLQKEGDTAIKFIQVADRAGDFTFNNLQSGSYMITCTHIGFQSYKLSGLRLDTTHQSIQLPVIIMNTANDLTLKEVVISAKKPFIEQKIDRTVVNVDAMISAAGSNALDAISKSPGVTVDANDNISLNGKSNVLVLIDDRPTYLSAQQLAAYLRSLPAGMLDKLELMSNPPAKYDANGNAIINIILKKNQAAGFNGGLNLGYNQGAYARLNDALNLNYRSPKFNLFGNIGYNHDQNYSDQTYSRYFTGSNIQQVSRYTYSTDGYNGRIGMDYFTSPKTTVGFSLSASTRPRFDLLDYTANQFNAANQLDSISRGYTHGQYQNRNYGINLNLHHKFDTSGKSITINLDQLNYNATANQQSPEISYLPDGSPVNSAQHAFNFPSNIHIYSAKADYDQPLNGKAEFSAGIKSSYVSTDNQSTGSISRGTASSTTMAEAITFVIAKISTPHTSISKRIGNAGAYRRD